MESMPASSRYLPELIAIHAGPGRYLDGVLMPGVLPVGRGDWEHKAGKTRKPS